MTVSESDYIALSKRTGVSVDEIKRRVEEVAKEKFSAIPDENKRLQQAFIYVRAKLLSKPPGKDIEVVVYGLKEPVKKSQKKISRVYVLYNDGSGIRRGVILFMDELASMYESAKLFTKYKVNVITTSKQVFMATPSTRFEGGKAVPPEKVIELLKQDTMNFVEFNINDPVPNLSRTVNKYYDEFDLRATRGIVVRATYKKDDEGNIQFGIYDLSDPENPDVTLTAWIPPPLFLYGEGSELYVYGTLQMSKQGIPQLMVQGIFPINPVPLST